MDYLHILFMNCEFETLERVKNVVTNANVNDVDENQENCLYYAYQNKDKDESYEITKYIIENFNININHTNKDGRLMYHIYTENDDFKFLELIDNRMLTANDHVPKYNRMYDHEYEYERVIFEDNLELFKNNFTEYEDDSLALACKYNSINIAAFCIREKYGLTVPIRNTETTPFAFACYHNNIVIANLLMNRLTKKQLNHKDTKNNIPIFYAKSRSFEQIKMKLLTMTDDDTIHIPDFKIFREDDFIFPSGYVEASGSYGSAVNVIEKSTNTKMVIKKLEISTEIIQPIMIEITALRYINKIAPNTAVKIYGVYMKDDEMHIVLESLEYTLQKLITIINELDDENYYYHFKQILRNLLQCAKSINSIGICHCDIKGDNVMIDSNGKLKLIDFGLSTFFGFMPSREIEANLFMNETLKPDCDNALNVDVFSIGIICFNYLLYKKNITRYESRIYYDKTNSTFTDSIDLIDLNELNLDPKLIDLFKHMLVDDVADRWFADDCLNHEYFTDKPFTPNRNEIVNFRHDQIHYKNTIFNEWKDIHFCKPNQILSTKLNDRMFYILSDWLISVSKKFRYPNIFYHIMPKILNLTKNEIERFYFQGYGVSIFYLEAFLLSYGGVPIDDMIYITDKSYNKNELNEMIFDSIVKSIEDKNPIFNFVPIDGLLEYLNFFLISNNFVSPIKTDIIIDKISAMIKLWVIFNREFDISVWELIIACYYYFNDEPIINHDKNENHQKMLEEVFNIASKCDKLKEIENLKITANVEPN
jgi:serine/threonine protein kinase